MKILQFPLTKIILCFVFGILLFPYLQAPPQFAIVLAAVSFCVLYCTYFFKNKNNFYSIAFALFVLTTSFAIGLSTASIHKETFHENHYTKYLNDENYSVDVTALITEKLKNTKKNNRYILEIQSIYGKEMSGKIMLNVSKKNNGSDLPTGSILHVRAVYYKNKKPFNPNQFDYGKYLEQKEIYGQLYCKADALKIVGEQSSLRSYFSNFREKIVLNLKKTSLSDNSLTVIVALLLGQKHDLSPLLMKEYQNAGAVHILAVSGLHVGIIMAFLLLLTKPISNSRKGKIIKITIILLSLWSFAFLAGLSPSILRSVTMFSFIAIGLQLKRTVNFYHTLLVSMLFILLISPSFIYDIGFQLSYLAVFFIVLVQPLLKSIWKPKNKILTYLWNIVTVSTAAQIGVMPLSIFYFHQFPGLFFVTNILVLPMLSIIMATGIVVVIVSSITIVPDFLVQLLDKLLQLMNYFIHKIASFDNFTFQNIPFSKEMLYLCYLMIFGIILWSLKPNFKRFSFAMISIIAVQLLFIYQKNEIANSGEGIVFNQRKASVFSERIGSEVTFFANDSLLDAIDQNSTFQSYLVGNFSKLKEKKPIENVLYINNKKIIQIDSSGIYNPNIKPDILIITQSPKINLERLLQKMKPSVIIADGSNFKTYSKRWEETCRKQKILFHNTHEKGFYKF